MSRERLIGALCLIGLIVVVAIGFWKTGGSGAPVRVLLPRRIQAVMGTDGMLAAVIAPDEHGRASDVLREAENTLRDIEAKLSVRITRSEISRLNRAATGVEFALSASTRAVLLAARQAHVDTDGTFDVTCRPQIELWRKAVKQGATPTDQQVADARNASNWSRVQLTDGGAVKQALTVQFDLGGIAKGYAIDRAFELLRRQGWSGGLVNVGGDIRCFGATPTGEPWTIDIENPFGEGKLGTLVATNVAVCTSGNYRRYFETDGRRRSHILDPRTGQPTEATCLVTVVAPDALTADIWATALSVLGPDGLDRLPEGIEALMVVGDEKNHRLLMTDGFWRWFRTSPTVIGRAESSPRMAERNRRVTLRKPERQPRTRLSRDSM